MMKRQTCGFCLALSALAFWVGVAQAQHIDVPNGDFEDWANIGDGVTGAGWSSFPGAANGMIADALGLNDEFWSNPSSFGSGWSSNGPAGDNGKFGLQHTRPSYYMQNPDTTQADPFNGHFIGFVNMDDGDGFDQEIQSATIGDLTPGMKYIVKVAVGARPNGGWNDVRYSISLVSNPTDDGPGLGSSGGDVLGAPSEVTLVPSTAVADGSDIVDLMYSYTATTADPYAIRITAHNALMQDGVFDDGSNGGTVDPGTNFRFTQGNWDNVRLWCVPEPGSLCLLGLAAFGMFCFRHRHQGT